MVIAVDVVATVVMIAVVETTQTAALLKHQETIIEEEIIHPLKEEASLHQDVDLKALPAEETIQGLDHL
jgi:hypothetical protein